MLYLGSFVCNIGSPSFSTIEVSCELLGNLVRVIVILNCTSCTGKHTTYTLTGDSPIVIPYLPAGNYIVDVIAVDISNDINRTVKVIVMSEEVTTHMSPTSGPTTNLLSTATLPTTTMTTSATTNMSITTVVPTTGNVPTS